MAEEWINTPQGRKRVEVGGGDDKDRTDVEQSEKPKSKGMPKQSDYATTGEWAAALRKYREGKGMETQALRKALGK